MGRGPLLHGVKQLGAIGNDQPGRPLISGEILPTDGDGVFDADGVVEIDDGIDAGQAALPLHPLEQRLGRAGGPLGLGTEAFEHLPPGGQMILCPGCTARRNGLAGPRQRLCADVAIDHGGPVDLDAQGPESRGQPGHPGINLWCHEWHSNSQ
ncbi:hypothetical protein D3C78_481980 [compost metagenome]